MIHGTNYGTRIIKVVWILLNKLYHLEDIRNIENIGFYKIFKITNDSKNNAVGQVFLPSKNIAVLSGLDTFSSLNTLTSFNSLQSSILFSDDIQTKGNQWISQNTPMNSF